MSTLDEALDYLRRGWAAIPAHSVRDGACTCGRAECDRPAKHPRVRWATYQNRLPSEEELLTWWKRWPEANIAIVTGHVSGIVVLDIDPGKGGDESLHELGPLPDTLTALTGGGGRHFVYAYAPEDAEIRNGAGLLPGIDVRGEKGYIIAPPSTHISGGQYRWDIELEGLDPILIPEVVAKLLTGWRPSIGEAEVKPAPVLDLEKLVQEGVPQGGRNATLAKVAGSYLGAGKSPEEVLQLCQGFNIMALRPPLDPEEVRRTVDSISKAEMAKRAVTQAVDGLLEGDGAADGDLEGKDREALLSQAWRRLGVPAVTRWRLLLGDSPEYILETPDREVNLGDDILNQRLVRKGILNHVGILMPGFKPADWFKIVQLLRKLAEEEEVEAQKAKEKVADWVEAYLENNPAQDWGEDHDKLRSAFRSGAILHGGYLWIQPAGINRFIEARYGDKLPVRALRALLRRAGWEPAQLRLGMVKVRGWRRAMTGETI